MPPPATDPGIWSRVTPETITVKPSSFSGLLPDRVHLTRRQVRAGNAILQLLTHYVVRLRHTVITGRRYPTLKIDGLSTAQSARLNL
jgi:hypothetical protein